MDENLAKKMAAVDAWARQMARADMAKSAQVNALVEAGHRAGVASVKIAAGIADLGRQLGTAALSYAKKNPLGAGLTAAGALGGAIHGGMQRDEYGRSRLSATGALTGAIGGGSLGHMAGQGVQSIQAGRAAGATLMDAAKDTATRGVQQGINWLNR